MPLVEAFGKAILATQVLVLAGGSVFLALRWFKDREARIVMGVTLLVILGFTLALRQEWIAF